MNDADFDDEWAEFEKDVISSVNSMNLNDKPLDERENALLKMREEEEKADHKLTNDLFSQTEVKFSQLSLKNNETNNKTINKPINKPPIVKQNIKKSFKKIPYKKSEPKQEKNKKYDKGSDGDSELDYCCDITDKIYSRLDSKHQKTF